MIKFGRQKLKALWLGPSLVLSLLYLYHIVPHAHDIQPHAPVHATPVSHDNHTHSHSHHDHQSDRSEQAHHHHELNPHFDSHMAQLQGWQPDLNRDHIYAVVVVNAETVERDERETILPRRDPPPESVFLSSRGPRAPPVQG